MEAFAAHYPPINHRWSTSPPLHRVLNHRHHGGVGRQSVMRSPTLQRFTTALNRSHQYPLQSPLTTTSYNELDLVLRSDSNFNSTMDDSGSKNEVKSGDGSSVDKGPKEPQKPSEIPPPPEKPLPGDCCGSGCVRCVWDVYYEELEEYNKLRKAESDSTVGSKVS